MQVKEMMTENVACCTADTKLGDVARMMVEHDCGANHHPLSIIGQAFPASGGTSLPNFRLT